MKKNEIKNIKNDKKITVAFTGGGTGGHIYPGLAIADELKEICKSKKIKLNIIWLGSSSGMDKAIVQKSSSINKFIGIPSGKLRRYFSFKNFTDVFKILFGCISSFFVLLKHKPVVLFSKGGFVSVPPCIMAGILKIPVCTHECDFTPGLATKINSKFATKILLSYEETTEYFSSALKNKIVVTGNPVRPIFYSTDKKVAEKFIDFDFTKKSKPILFVMGGSLGAKQINDLVLENIEWICENFYVIHQTGSSNFNEKISLSENAKKSYKQYPFIYEQMPHIIDYADIVLSRAGANSLWECVVLKKPMILVPLCGSGTRGDQVDNAEYFEKKGAAIVLKGEYANSNFLINALKSMLDNKKRKLFSSACNKLLPTERSAYKIAQLLSTEFVFCKNKNIK